MSDLGLIMSGSGKESGIYTNTNTKKKENLTE